MTTDRWAALIGNLGILFGLILVAYELQQNSQLVRIQLVREGNIGANQVYGAWMGENPMETLAKAVERPEDLTYSEFLAADATLFTTFNLFYGNFELAEEGIYDRGDWQQDLEVYVGWYLANPFGRAWWAEEKEFFPAEFTAFADEILADTTARDSHSYWKAIRARLDGE